MNIEQLRSQIVAQFKGHWALNDTAHRQEHFEAVYQCGREINQLLDLGYEDKHILFAAYFHDLFSWSRVNHHELAFHWMMSTDHPLIVENLDASENNLVAWACYQHRASFTGQFKFGFCELINSADRGFPAGIEHQLERAKQCRRQWHPGVSEDEVTAGAIAHIKEKFGTGGYARYPDMYIRAFGDTLLQKQRETVDGL